MMDNDYGKQDGIGSTLQIWKLMYMHRRYSQWLAMQELGG